MGMKSTKDKIIELFNLLIKENLQNLDKATGDFEFSEKAKDFIRQISELAKTTEIYKNSENERNDFITASKADGCLNSKDLYINLCQKVLDAPTDIHLIASVILLVPIIDDLLKEKSEEVAE